MVVADDYRAVNAAAVAAMTKYDLPDLWCLTLTILGSTGPVMLRFEQADQRDGFYKELVEAMRA
jgi:hypothetical protein